jgi:hypothetical protein
MSRWRRRRKQLLEEFEAHVELEMQENLAAEMPFEEARSAAKKRFGNPLTAAKESRAAWGVAGETDAGCALCNADEVDEGGHHAAEDYDQ